MKKFKYFLMVIVFIISILSYSQVNYATSISWTIEVNGDGYEYTGKKIQPDIFVYVNKNDYPQIYNTEYIGDENEVCLDESEYKISYSPKTIKKVGRYSATVILPNGSKKTVHFKVIPQIPKKIKKNSSSDSINVRWNH